MSISVFEHPWLSGLFADEPMAALWSPEAGMAHMLAFEAAWSEAQGAPETAAAIRAYQPDLAALAGSTARDGVVVPALVKALRAATGDEDVHRGATSQDVIDTALALTLQGCTDLLEDRLRALEEALASLTDRFGAHPMSGRTRMQLAKPITVADRVETWRLPLAAHRDRLAALRGRVELVQIGGPVGDRAGLEPAFIAQVAAVLGLSVPPRAWHAMREGVADYASGLSLISGSLGKMGQDVALMAQQGLGEIALSGGGGSSAMPHKQNPVLAELLVTLARFNATQVAGMHQALVHEQERSGAAWSLEWMILPQMALATGRGLDAALDLATRVERIGQS